MGGITSSVLHANKDIPVKTARDNRNLFFIIIIVSVYIAYGKHLESRMLLNQLSFSAGNVLLFSLTVNRYTPSSTVPLNSFTLPFTPVGPKNGGVNV